MEMANGSILIFLKKMTPNPVKMQFSWLAGKWSPSSLRNYLIIILRLEKRESAEFPLNLKRKNTKKFQKTYKSHLQHTFIYIKPQNMNKTECKWHTAHNLPQILNLFPAAFLTQQ